MARKHVPTFMDQNMVKHTYASVIEACKGEPYTMSLVGNAAHVVRETVNQGIDSHLEACFIPDFGDSYEVEGNRLNCKVSPQSLPVLLRRLFDSGHDDAMLLASDILETLKDD